jgi:hypothetical protein
MRKRQPPTPEEAEVMAAVAAEMKRPEAKAAYKEANGNGTQPPVFTFRRFCEIRVLKLSEAESFPMNAVKTPPASA